jgi:N-acetylglucosamine-6-sulfatase
MCGPDAQKTSQQSWGKKSLSSRMKIAAPCLLLGSLILASLGLPAHLAAQTTDPRPNIVFLLVDDLDYNYTRQFWPEVLPSLLKLKANGLEFANAFVSSSVCCPSRAAILSGKWGYITHVLSNKYTKPNGGWPAFAHMEPFTFPALLNQSGYATGIYGKYMNGWAMQTEPMPLVPYGWTEGKLTVNKGNNTSVKVYQGYDYDMLEWQNGHALDAKSWDGDRALQHHGRAEEDYMTDVVTRGGLDFIRRHGADKSKPFMLYLSPTAPHFPLAPAPRHAAKTLARWRDHQIADQPNTFRDDGALATKQERRKPADKPYWLQKTWRKRMRQADHGRGIYQYAALEKVPKGISDFRHSDFFFRMGSLYAINDMIDAIVGELQAQGLWENTLLVFMSDNGYQFGNHGLYQKSTPYEESIHIPLVVAGGRKFFANPGAVDSSWVVNVDIAPTFLEAAGITVPGDFSGRSWMPILRKRPADAVTKDYVQRTQFLLEFQGPGMAADIFPGWDGFHYFFVPSFAMDLPSYRGLRIRHVGADGRTCTYKYVEWARYEGLPKRIAPERELYNLDVDPFELDNLLHYQPEKYAALAQDFAAIIATQYAKE